MKTFLQIISCAIFSLLLTACNGASSESPNETISQTPNDMTLSATHSAERGSQIFANNEVIVVSATLLDTFNKPIANAIVNFSSDLGTFSQATGLTNSDGVASVEFSGNELLGAGTITVRHASLEISANFELYAPDVSAPEVPNLAISMTVDGLSENRFEVGNIATVFAHLSNSDGSPIANKIIQFSAEIGDLTFDTALTNASGVAQVTLQSTENLGAGVISASYTASNDTSISALFNYQVLAANTPEPESYKIGHFSQSGEFIEGQLGLTLGQNQSLATISAGATLGVNLAIVDSNNQRLLTPTQINFSSNCAAAERASIDNSSLTINGVAQATYQDLSCAGSTGTTDIITASVVINEQTETISRSIDISPENIGAIGFVSATPETIVLKGTGGAGNQEISIVSFNVTSDIGNPMVNQLVNFSLNTDVGGLELSPQSGFTNSEGMISTQVKAGTVPTAVRVSAETTSGDNTLFTQSDLLSINTGLPDQNSFTLAATTLNVEDINGNTTTIAAYLADSFNNPVPDGTTVNFTTEGGQITPSCTTQGGRCEVTWTASEPRVSNHRITILATAIGHETFYDTNGNNQVDSADGAAITDNGNISSGFVRSLPSQRGFNDLSEAWRDDNEDKRFSSGEIFIDFDQNGSFTTADSKFNGPQCEGSICSNQNSLHVRKSLVLITSSSSARFQLSTGSTTYLQGNSSAFSIAEGDSIALTLSYADMAEGTGQILAAGSTVSVEADLGELKGVTSVTVPNSIGTSNPNGALSSMSFFIKNTNDPTEPGDLTDLGFLTVTITSPSGVITSGSYAYTVEGN